MRRHDEDGTQRSIRTFYESIIPAPPYSQKFDGGFLGS
jgi:hypothetical protein